MDSLDLLLRGLAATGQTMTYGALARELGWRVQDLTAALESMMEDDARAGHALRAALCEGRTAGGLPARGFFNKAFELGFDVSDPAGFVASQRKALSLG